MQGKCRARAAPAVPGIGWRSAGALVAVRGCVGIDDHIPCQYMYVNAREYEGNSVMRLRLTIALCLGFSCAAGPPSRADIISVDVSGFSYPDLPFVPSWAAQGSVLARNPPDPPPPPVHVA